MYKCRVCGASCDGSMMRTHPKYSRVRDMLIAEEIPRLPSGGIALCHSCQRGVYFAKGFLPFLVAKVKRAAVASIQRGDRERCPSCGHQETYFLKTRNKRKCKACGRQFSDGITPYQKMSDEKRSEVMDAVRRLGIRAASKECGVSYRTAWAVSKIGMGYQDTATHPTAPVTDRQEGEG